MSDPPRWRHSICKFASIPSAKESIPSAYENIPSATSETCRNDSKTFHLYSVWHSIWGGPTRSKREKFSLEFSKAAFHLPVRRYTCFQPPKKPWVDKKPMERLDFDTLPPRSGPGSDPTHERNACWEYHLSNGNKTCE